MEDLMDQKQFNFLVEEAIQIVDAEVTKGGLHPHNTTVEQVCSVLEEQGLDIYCEIAKEEKDYTGGSGDYGWTCYRITLGLETATPLNIIVIEEWKAPHRTVTTHRKWGE